jgi:DNA repair protein RadC
VDHGRAIIERFGDFRRLAAAGVGELCAVKGVGPVKAAQILAALEIAKRYGEFEFKPGQALRGSGDVYAHFRERLASESREHFYAVLLDNKHRKIKDISVSQGSLTASIVHPRDVYLPVIRESAAAVIFVHNHPSGDPTPSSEDRAVTDRLQRAGELLGIELLDHVVVGDARCFSFAEETFLPLE